jgi:hypothetical protein
MSRVGSRGERVRSAAKGHRQHESILLIGNIFLRPGTVTRTFPKFQDPFVGRFMIILRAPVQPVYG